MFAPVPSRLAWLALHVGLIVAGVIAIHSGWGGWWAVPFYSLIIGHSFAGCAFVGHEALHGAVVRHPGWRNFVGWISFLPFTLSPRLWIAWHNKTHHGHTMQEGVDPDCYPSLTSYQQTLVTRIADRFSFALDRPAGPITLVLGFTGQTAQMLLRWSRTTDALLRRDRWLMAGETLAGVAVWTALAVWLGPLQFLFAFVIPLVVGNLVVISYILTNHSLSPLTDVNDALVNSLTVEVPAIVNLLHLNFGLHTEHHLFPSMSSAYAPLVRDQLVARWPERYQSMPWVTALGLLARTPRIYRTPTLLVDPLTGREVPALLPRTPNQEVSTPPRRKAPSGRARPSAEVATTATPSRSLAE